MVVCFQNLLFKKGLHKVILPENKQLKDTYKATSQKHTNSLDYSVDKKTKFSTDNWTFKFAEKSTHSEE